MKSAIVVRNFVAILFLLAVLVALPAARADQSNQATKVTFSQPVQIPGRVLPAGTYWFELPEDIGFTAPIGACCTRRFSRLTLDLKIEHFEVRDEMPDLFCFRMEVGQTRQQQTNPSAHSPVSKSAEPMPCKARPPKPAPRIRISSHSGKTPIPTSPSSSLPRRNMRS